MYRVKLSVVTFGRYWASLRGTSLTAQIWVYSSQALTKSLGVPDLLIGHAGGCSLESAVELLGVVVHLDHSVQC
jgi:hypothetical protein